MNRRRKWSGWDGKQVTAEIQTGGHGRAEQMAVTSNYSYRKAVKDTDEADSRPAWTWDQRFLSVKPSWCEDSRCCGRTDQQWKRSLFTTDKFNLMFNLMTEFIIGQRCQECGKSSEMKTLWCCLSPRHPFVGASEWSGAEEGEGRAAATRAQSLRAELSRECGSVQIPNLKRTDFKNFLLYLRPSPFSPVISLTLGPSVFPSTSQGFWPMNFSQKQNEYMPESPTDPLSWERFCHI